MSENFDSARICRWLRRRLDIRQLYWFLSPTPESLLLDYYTNVATERSRVPSAAFGRSILVLRSASRNLYLRDTQRLGGRELKELNYT